MNTKLQKGQRFHVDTPIRVADRDIRLVDDVTLLETPKPGIKKILVYSPCFHGNTLLPKSVIAKSRQLPQFLRVHHIKWDTDGRKIKLPSEDYFEIGLDALPDFDPAEQSADLVSDKHGYCIFGCEWEWVNEMPKNQTLVLVTMNVQEGENSHTSHSIHQSGERYLRAYLRNWYGSQGHWDGDTRWFANDTIAVTIKKVQPLTAEEAATIQRLGLIP